LDNFEKTSLGMYVLKGKGEVYSFYRKNIDDCFLLLSYTLSNHKYLSSSEKWKKTFNVPSFNIFFHTIVLRIDLLYRKIHNVDFNKKIWEGKEDTLFSLFTDTIEKVFDFTLFSDILDSFFTILEIMLGKFEDTKREHVAKLAVLNFRPFANIIHFLGEIPDRIHKYILIKEKLTNFLLEKADNENIFFDCSNKIPVSKFCSVLERFREIFYNSASRRKIILFLFKSTILGLGSSPSYNYIKNLYRLNYDGTINEEDKEELIYIYLHSFNCNKNSGLNNIYFDFLDNLMDLLTLNFKSYPYVATSLLKIYVENGFSDDYFQLLFMNLLNGKNPRELYQKISPDLFGKENLLKNILIAWEINHDKMFPITYTAIALSMSDIDIDTDIEEVKLTKFSKEGDNFKLLNSFLEYLNEHNVEYNPLSDEEKEYIENIKANLLHVLFHTGGVNYKTAERDYEQLAKGYFSKSSIEEFQEEFPQVFPEEFPQDFQEEFPQVFPEEFPQDFQEEFPKKNINLYTFNLSSPYLETKIVNQYKTSPEFGHFPFSATQAKQARSDEI